MPYILSPPVPVESEGMWLEGPAYERKNIYSIREDKLPPVHYDAHTLKPHSLTHAEGAAHIVPSGRTIDQYFSHPGYFYGPCVVLRLTGNGYKASERIANTFQWDVSLEELKTALNEVCTDLNSVEKVILTTDHYPVSTRGYHDPNYVLTLSQDAALFLCDLPKFNMYGTSWKSTDFQPGSKERPIHKTLFKKAVIFELLDLQKVPAGEYFFVGFPLRLVGASESPVVPVLFEQHEIS